MTSLHFTVDLTKRNDASKEPAWSHRIDRWYQLDELGYSFCEALHEWRYLDSFPKADIVFLAIEGGSNIADQDFIASGSQSPAKFVYTLPNISGAVIFQMLKTHGKLYCLCQGHQTLTQALKEAQSFAQDGKIVWVFSSPAPGLTNPQSREIQFHCFN